MSEPRLFGVHEIPPSGVGYWHTTVKVIGPATLPLADALTIAGTHAKWVSSGRFSVARWHQFLNRMTRRMRRRKPRRLTRWLARQRRRAP